ncbi:MAG: DUF4252 domain-containing protein [Deltaproteobacteria bacterium]
MKKTILIYAICLCTFALTGQSNAIDKLFADKTTSEDFNYTSISSSMFGSISKSTENSAEINEIISNLKGLKLLKTERNPMDFYLSAKGKIESAGYEELMSVKEKGSNVVFYTTIPNGKIVKELILLVGNKQSSVMMSFTGNINLDKISKLGKALNFEGADKLKRLEDK